MTKYHVRLVSRDTLWTKLDWGMDVQKCLICGQTRDKWNMKVLFSSCEQKRGFAERLSKLSGVEVSYKHMLIHCTASHWWLFKMLYPQLLCCVRYHLIELNLHGGSAVFHHTIWLKHAYILNCHLSSLQSCDRRWIPQLYYVTSCNFLQWFWSWMLPVPFPLMKRGGALGQD